MVPCQLAVMFSTLRYIPVLYPAKGMTIFQVRVKSQARGPAPVAAYQRVGTPSSNYYASLIQSLYLQLQSKRIRNNNHGACRHADASDARIQITACGQWYGNGVI